MPGSSFPCVFPALWGAGSNPVTPIEVDCRECPILGASGNLFMYISTGYYTANGLDQRVSLLFGRIRPLCRPFTYLKQAKTAKSVM